MEQKNIPENIMIVVKSIVDKFGPEKIYLFSNKRGGVGKSAGFKLGVIVEHGDLQELERQIYLQVDSEVPFDIVLYTPEIWAELLDRKGSFAQRIIAHGVEVYG